MRHLGSLLIAAVFAPSVFLLTGTGLSAFASALDDNKAVDPLGTIAALGALLLAGVLYAILVLARLSPLGPGLAGLASLGMSGWAMFDIVSYRANFGMLQVHMGGSVGELGLGVLLGVPLVATIMSPRRWRKDPDAVPGGYPPPPQYHQPAAVQPDPTRHLPAQPAYQPLPDAPPPSLRYPTSSHPLVSSPAATAVMPSAPVADESPTVPVMVPPELAPPLPKRTPSKPPSTALKPPSNADTERRESPPVPPPARLNPALVTQPVAEEPPTEDLAASRPAAAPVSAPPSRPVSAPPASAPVSGPPASARPVSAPPMSAAPVSGPPASAPVSAPPVSAAPAQSAPDSADEATVALRGADPGEETTRQIR